MYRLTSILLRSKHEKPGNLFADIPAVAVWFSSITRQEVLQKPNLIVKLNAFLSVLKASPFSIVGAQRKWLPSHPVPFGPAVVQGWLHCNSHSCPWCGSAWLLHPLGMLSLLTPNTAEHLSCCCCHVDGKKRKKKWRKTKTQASLKH